MDSKTIIETLAALLGRAIEAIEDRELAEAKTQIRAALVSADLLNLEVHRTELRLALQTGNGTFH